MIPHSPGSRALQIALAALIFSTLCLVGSVVPLLAEPGDDDVIVIFPPGTSRGDALNAADTARARIIGYGEVGWVLAVATDRPARQAFANTGVLLILNAARAAWLCGIDLTESTRTT